MILNPDDFDKAKNWEVEEFEESIKDLPEEEKTLKRLQFEAQTDGTIEGLLIKMLSEEVQKEIDREVVDQLTKAANGSTD